MKIVIEKELCNPIDGYTIPGPYYHVVGIDEETGRREVLKTFEKDIMAAARYAEREMDIDALEVAFKKNPDSFKSSVMLPPNYLPEPIEVESYEGTITTAGSDYTTVRYEDKTGNRQLFYAAPGNYSIGDKVAIIIFKQK